ncbi:MAG: M28 family peptidase [Candidatus Krumholzibacteriia bacterium]
MLSRRRQDGGRSRLAGWALAAVAMAAAGPAWTTDGGAAAPERSESRLRERVAALCGPELAGRAAGSPGAERAASMIGEWMSAAGLEAPAGGSFFQTVPLEGEALAGRSDRNVVGVLEGQGRLRSRWVVVGAHFDHLGRTERAPGPPAVPREGQYYPGANDNAAGVAALLELAHLSRGAPVAPVAPGDDRRSILFVAFAAEEVGLQGSRRFVADLPVPRDSVDLMLNLDTVGRLGEGRLHVGGVGTAPGLDAHLDRAAAAGVELRPSQSGWAGSDHVPFLAAGIPALFFFTGPYPDYNRVTDTPETLDFPGLAQVTGLVARLLQQLCTDPAPFPFREVAGLPDDREPTPADGSRSTWFGSVPDFDAGAGGYRLAGVVAGSPAARAGLGAGDVLVRFGGEAVTDLPSFTRALRLHRPGEMVEVEVRRDGKLMRLTVELADRAERWR